MAVAFQLGLGLVGLGGLGGGAMRIAALHHSALGAGIAITVGKKF